MAKKTDICAACERHPQKICYRHQNFEIRNLYGITPGRRMRCRTKQEAIHMAEYLRFTRWRHKAVFSRKTGKKIYDTEPK